MCAKPRAPPPLKAKPIFGRFGGAASWAGAWAKADDVTPSAQVQTNSHPSGNDQRPGFLVFVFLIIL